MRRYGDIGYLLKMPFDDGLNIIARAFYNERKERYFQMYVIDRVFMTEPVSFDQYFERNTKVVKKEDPRTVHKKVDNILKKALTKGGEKNRSI